MGNIKIDEEIGCGAEDCIHLAQNVVQLWALVNTVKNLP
jgi:hypothetical protein